MKGSWGYNTVPPKSHMRLSMWPAWLVPLHVPDRLEWQPGRELRSPTFQFCSIGSSIAWAFIGRALRAAVQCDVLLIGSLVNFVERLIGSPITCLHRTGVQAIRPGAELVAIHDSARPLVTADDTRRCCQDALEVLLGFNIKLFLKIHHL